MNKKDLSERDICSKFISPAVKRAGWDWMMQIREEVAFTNASRPMSSVSRKLGARQKSAMLIKCI